jgi:hypothetical protein
MIISSCCWTKKKSKILARCKTDQASIFSYDIYMIVKTHHYQFIKNHGGYRKEVVNLAERELEIIPKK